jgi:hypothetical protein
MADKSGYLKIPSWPVGVAKHERPGGCAGIPDFCYMHLHTCIIALLCSPTKVTYSQSGLGMTSKRRHLLDYIILPGILAARSYLCRV